MTDQSKGIDTTPSFPRPPQELIDAAATHVPNVLANVKPRHDGAVAVVASRLTTYLQDSGHSLAAAHWAVNQLVQKGMLVAAAITVELPSFGTRRGRGFAHLYGGRRTERIEWSGGGTGTIPIPKNKPAPFDSFQVVATEALWKWWRQTAERQAPKEASPESRDDIEAGTIDAKERSKMQSKLPNNVEASSMASAGCLPTPTAGSGYGNVNTLPRTMIVAYQRLAETFRDGDSSDVCAAIERFVDELCRVPAWRAELQRRAVFVEEQCVQGSAFRRALNKAYRHYHSQPRKAVGPGISTEKLAIPKLRCPGECPRFLGHINKIRARVENGIQEGFFGVPAKAAFEELLQEIRRIHHDAERLEADGCHCLYHVYLASKSRRSDWLRNETDFLASGVGGFYLGGD